MIGIKEGPVVEQDGDLDLTIRQMKADNTIEVGIFDGSVYDVCTTPLRTT